MSVNQESPRVHAPGVSINLVRRRTGSQKPGFCREDELQLAETAKNPVSWVLRRQP